MTCPRYNECLTKAAFADQLDLGCRQCKGGIPPAVIVKDLASIPDQDEVSLAEAARILGVTEYHLRQWRKAGSGPAYRTTDSQGNPVKYLVNDLKNWVVEKAPQKELTTPQAARFLGLSMSGLRNWRRMGKGPPFRKKGNACVYPIDELTRYRDMDSKVRI
jgi:DNA-binding transcriptional regulator YiaG